MWKCVFGEMDMCICLCQNTGAMNRSPTPVGVFRGYFVGVRCIINNPFAAKWQAVSSRRGRFIVPVYLYSTCICNPFETHSRNVRNVFVICVLHIRRVKVWFLRCKSMVFGVQKLPFWLTKTTFLTCKKWVFVSS